MEEVRREVRPGRRSRASPSLEGVSRGALRPPPSDRRGARGRRKAREPSRGGRVVLMSFPATKTARTGVSGRLDESSTKVHRKCTDETVSGIAGHRKVPALKNLPEGFSRGFPMEMPGSSWTPRRFVTPWKARTPMEGSGFRDPIGDSATLSGASISAGGCRRADHVMPDGHGPSASSADLR